MNDDDLDAMLDDCSQQLDQKLNLQDKPEPPKMQSQTTGPSSAGPTVKDDLGLADEIDFSKMPLNPDEMKEASKLFEEAMKEMGTLSDENPGMENPFLLACNQMFKDFEGMSKEQTS